MKDTVSVQVALIATGLAFALGVVLGANDKTATTPATPTTSATEPGTPVLAPLTTPLPAP